MALALLAPLPGRGKTLGAGEGEVDIVAWPGSIERGETDKRFDWVSGFEADTGCHVNARVVASSDEMLALIGQGGLDLATVSSDATERLIAAHKAQAVDLSLVPAWKSVDPRLQSAPWYTVGGRHYGVPFQWAPNVLLYSTKVFAAPPHSWSVVFEEQTLPDGRSNKGRVDSFDGPMSIADAALYLMTQKPELGIRDPYELTARQYAASLAVLRGQHPLVHRYWHDADAEIEDFSGAGVVAASAWPLQANQLVGEEKPVASTIPVEGATGWADTTMLLAQAKHPNCAYRWLQHSLDPTVQGDVAAWLGSVPVVPAGCKGNPLLGANGCDANGGEAFDRVHIWRTPVAQCRNQGSCVPYARWLADFSAIVGGR